MNIIEDKPHPAVFWQNSAREAYKVTQHWRKRMRQCYLPFDQEAYDFAAMMARNNQRTGRAFAAAARAAMGIDNDA